MKIKIKQPLHEKSSSQEAHKIVKHNNTVLKDMAHFLISLHAQVQSMLLKNGKRLHYLTGELINWSLIYLNVSCSHIVIYLSNQ